MALVSTSPASTVAAAVPEPALVGRARSLVAEGASRGEGAKRLVELADGNHVLLSRAQRYWVRQMRSAKYDWEDFAPSAVLRMLEEAMAMTRTMPVPRPAKKQARRADR